jgi:hypothetical protein
MKRVNKERRAFGAKRKLQKIIEKRFETAIIGILARCEKHFGDLWGYESEYPELSKQQKNMLEIWECLRSDILNHGNTQSRAAIDEISKYNIEEDVYQIDFIVKKKD